MYSEVVSDLVQEFSIWEWTDGDWRGGNVKFKQLTHILEMLVEHTGWFYSRLSCIFSTLKSGLDNFWFAGCVKIGIKTGWPAISSHYVQKYS